MFTWPVGPVEVFFYWPEAVFENFYWPGAIVYPKRRALIIVVWTIEDVHISEVHILPGKM